MLQNELLVVMTIPNPNIRTCDCYRKSNVKLSFRIPKGTLSVVMVICAFAAIPKVFDFLIFMEKYKVKRSTLIFSFGIFPRLLLEVDSY